MAKAELKTKVNSADVAAFINSIEDNVKREDSKIILEIMQQATGAKPKMWGTSIIGFGNQHLKYASGRELDWFIIGFSPRKQTLTLYVFNKPEQEYSTLLNKLGKYKTGKGCLYVNKLSDINIDVLKEILKKSV